MIAIIRMITIIIKINIFLMVSKIISSRDAKRYSVSHVNGASFIVISFTCAGWDNELSANLTSFLPKPELRKGKDDRGFNRWHSCTHKRDEER